MKILPVASQIRGRLVRHKDNNRWCLDTELGQFMLSEGLQGLPKARQEGAKASGVLSQSNSRSAVVISYTILETGIPGYGS